MSKHDPPSFLGVDVGTSLPAGYFGTVFPTVGMELEFGELKPISVKSSMFLNLEFDAELSFVQLICIICISLSVLSASSWADCMMTCVLSFSNSPLDGVYLGEGSCGSLSQV